MDKALEKRITRKVQSGLGKVLEKHGFEHTKPSFYARRNGDWYEVIHLHKFSYAPAFRVHIALRSIDDSFKAIALNGPESETRKEYKIVFSGDFESINKCVEEMTRFIQEVGRAWFTEMSEMTNEGRVSKLGVTLSDNPTVRQQTKKLLGVKV